MASNPTPKIGGVSMGMVIIDEIHMPNRPPLLNVLGGSGSFVTLGLRLFSTLPQEIGCLIISGNDFPSEVKEKIETWGITLAVKVRESEKSSRGILVYKDNTFGPKDFQYLGTPLRAIPSDLINTPLLHSSAFHFFGSPSEILTHVPELLHLRAVVNITTRPFIVWEPLPSACRPENRIDFFKACDLVDVFSPNHLEITALFDERPKGDNISDLPPLPFDSEALESYGQTILSSSPANTNTNLVVVIRAANHGALSLSHHTRPTWLPPFYPDSSQKVVDPTGAGNTFLGGYIAGWLKTGEISEAVKWGHVAASFALEQIGLPVKGVDGKGREVWNGVCVRERLRVYKEELGRAMVRSEGLV